MEGKNKKRKMRTVEEIKKRMMMGGDEYICEIFGIPNEEGQKIANSMDVTKKKFNSYIEMAVVFFWKVCWI